MLVAVALGLSMFGRRVGAQPAPKRDDAPSRAADAPAKKTARTVLKAADAGAPAEPPKTEEGTDAGAAADPLSYAVLQTDDDFPPDMSDEEKAAIGTGKVPIHREGRFRSPLAHPRFGSPTIAKVGLVVKEIRNFEVKTGGFEAEFFLSLTGDKELPPFDPVFTNGHEVSLSAIVDTPTFKLFEVSGSFTTQIDLRKYPFDEQDLEILLEDRKAGIDQIIFVPDQNRTSLDSSFRLAGWGVAGVSGISYRHKYAPRFDRDDLYVSRYKFDVTMARFATSAAFSVYVPAFIIVLISLTGMWVPPGELEVRSNAGAPMLAAAVLFHYSLIQELPATGYLTNADKLMLGVYLSLLLNMASTWLTLLGDEEWADLVFRVGKWVVPIATAGIMGATILL